MYTRSSELLSVIIVENLTQRSRTIFTKTLFFFFASSFGQRFQSL